MRNAYLSAGLVSVLVLAACGKKDGSNSEATMEDKAAAAMESGQEAMEAGADAMAKGVEYMEEGAEAMAEDAK